MPITPTTRRYRTAARGAAALLILAAVATPAATQAATPVPTDPGLNQTISSAEPIVHGDHVIASGHVDMGPKFDGNTWKFLIHDDAARANKNAQTVWRYPTETVLQVVDAAKLTVPKGKAYSFVGAAPGSTVWVVPQTQKPDVVWAGWNTQDPTVMARIDRGATFSVDGVQGPGTLTVFLQSGDFGSPQVLWDSRKTGAQNVFVDTNTHTHANWVFTKPGVYLVRMTASATLVNGTRVSDIELLRFAVGSATSTGDALKAAWKGAAPSATSQPSSSASAAVPSADDKGDDLGPLVPILIAAIVLVAVALIVGFVIAVMRGNQAKKQVLAARASSAPTPERSTPEDGSGA